MSKAQKPPREPYRPPSSLDQRVNEFDGLVEQWLNRVYAYVSRRWPRLGRWLAGQ